MRICPLHARALALQVLQATAVRVSHVYRCCVRSCSVLARSASLTGDSTSIIDCAHGLAPLPLAPCLLNTSHSCALAQSTHHVDVTLADAASSRGVQQAAVGPQHYCTPSSVTENEPWRQIQPLRWLQARRWRRYACPRFAWCCRAADLHIANPSTRCLPTLLPRVPAGARLRC